MFKKPAIEPTKPTNTMSNKRVFCSFDYDNDKNLKELLIGQSKNSDSPFEVSDWSMKEAAPEPSWEEEAEKRIKRSDVVIVVLGSKTHSAPGVKKEVKMARDNSVSIFQLKLRTRILPQLLTEDLSTTGRGRTLRIC